jgi:hypothetical protein
LLAGAALLVLVVVGFLGLARWKAHRFLTELPAKLGADNDAPSTAPGRESRRQQAPAGLRPPATRFAASLQKNASQAYPYDSLIPAAKNLHPLPAFPMSDRL